MYLYFRVEVLWAPLVGVFKALASNNIKIDIVAGTSIGGVNAAIIAGGKQEEHPEKVLEQYWLELAEASTSSYGYSSICSFSRGHKKIKSYFPSKINHVILWFCASW
jgi:predicted acylesterase/phospholipase RssA